MLLSLLVLQAQEAKQVMNLPAVLSLMRVRIGDEAIAAAVRGAKRVSLETSAHGADPGGITTRSRGLGDPHVPFKASFMKPLPPQHVPGNTDAERFDNSARTMFTVSKEDLMKREAKWKGKISLIISGNGMPHRLLIALVTILGMHVQGCAQRQDNGRTNSPEASREATRRFTSGSFHLNKGAYSAAVMQFEAAIKFDSNLTDAWLGLGEAREKSGYRAAAVAAYRRYLELAPEAEKASAIRDRIEKLLARPQLLDPPAAPPASPTYGRPIRVQA